MADPTTRTPPSNIEAEVCTLGSMVIEPSRIASVRDLVTAEAFYRPAHQLLFSAITSIADRGDPVDLVSVRGELQATGRLEACGGIEYIADIVANVPDTANARYYAGQVRDKSTKRAIIQAAGTASAAAYRDAEPAGEILAAWQLEAYGLERGQDDRGICDVASTTANVIRSATTRDQGLALGIPDLDFATGGMRPGNYMILAARPGRGKTTLACQIAAWLCERAKPVLYVSREMSESELSARLCCNMGQVDALHVRRGRASPEECVRLALAKQAIDRWQLRIDTRSRTVPAIAAQIRRMRHEVGQPALVIVDYFQLLTGPGRSRYEMFSDISTDLKRMLLSHGLPGIVLAQFRRPQAGQKEMRPRKTDLKETGALEQDADQIVLLHLQDQHVKPMETNALWGCLDKNRHGPEIGWPDEMGPADRRVSLAWEPMYLRMTPNT